MVYRKHKRIFQNGKQGAGYVLGKISVLAAFPNALLTHFRLELTQGFESTRVEDMLKTSPAAKGGMCPDSGCKTLVVILDGCTSDIKALAPWLKDDQIEYALTLTRPA